MFATPPPLTTASLPDRRHWPRIVTMLTRARIAWRTHGLRVNKAPARLIDISEGGARLVTDSPTLPGQTVWLGLEALPWEWVKATVQEAVPVRHGWEHRLCFEEPCPPGLIERAASRRAESAPAWRGVLQAR